MGASYPIAAARGGAFVMPNLSYAERLLSLSPIAFWRMNETSGTAAVCSVNSAQNGTYARDVSTMGTEASPVTGEVAPTFDGTQDVLSVYSATFATAFNTTAAAAGSISFWVKVPSAVWTDGTQRHFFTFRDDTNNYVQSQRHTNDNYLRHVYRAGAVSSTIDVTSQSDTDWVNWIITWDVTADEVKLYKNNVQVGDTQTGLGTWLGPIINNYTLIGASYITPNNPHSGSISNFAVFAKVLSESERAVCANP